MVRSSSRPRACSSRPRWVSFAAKVEERRPMPNEPAAPAHEPAILTLNGGSSSLKLAVFTTKAPLRRLVTGAVSRVGQGDAKLSITAGSAPAVTRALGDVDHAGALDAALAEIERGGPLVARLVAVGHRIAHGGARYARAERVTPEVI